MDSIASLSCRREIRKEWRYIFHLDISTLMKCLFEAAHL